MTNKQYYNCPLKAAIITLNSGEEVLVDERDYEWLSQYKWSASPSSKPKIYAATHIKDKRGKWRKKYMHQLIVRPTVGHQVDHINGNALDNRRENLRMVSPTQNAQNRGRNSGIKYKGVRKTPKGHYRMTISKTYKTQEEAAVAYNKIATTLFGEFAYQNQIIMRDNKQFFQPERE